MNSKAVLSALLSRIVVEIQSVHFNADTYSRFNLLPLKQYFFF
jgi:hypothetical protein